MKISAYLNLPIFTELVKVCSDLVPKLRQLTWCFLQHEANNLRLGKNFSVYSLLPHSSCIFFFFFFKCRCIVHRHLKELGLTKLETVSPLVPSQMSGSTVPGLVLWLVSDMMPL